MRDKYHSRRIKIAVVISAAVISVTACQPPDTGSSGPGSSSSASITSTTMPTENEPGTTTPGTTTAAPPTSAEPTGPFEPVDPGAPSDWEPENIGNNIVPKPTTIVAAPGNVLSVTGDPSSAQSVVLAPGQAVPAVGGFLSVGIDQGTPSGVLGRVTAVATSDSGVTTVEIVPATIEDAYDAFQVNNVVTLDDAVSFDPGESNPGARSGPSRSPSLSKSVSVGAFDCTTEGGITASARFDFGQQTAQVTFDAFRRYLRVTLELRPTLATEIGITAGTSCTLKDSVTPKVFVPVAGPFGIEFKPTLSISVRANTTLTSEMTLVATSGFEVSESRIRALASAPRFEQTFDVRSDTVGADVFLGLKGSLTLAGRVSAGFLAGPQVDFDAVRQSGCFRATGAVTIGAFIEANLITSNWSARLATTTPQRVEIATACRGTGGTTATSTPPTTTDPPAPEPPVIVPGQLTNLQILPSLQCSIESPTDGRSVFYAGTNCGTHLAIDGTTYGFIGSPYTVISGPSVTGTGSAADPLVIRTSVAAGDTGVTLDQIDTFVEGSSLYNTAITVNNSGQARAVVLSRAADCYLNQSDFGIGELFPSAVSCTSSNGRRISWTDLSGGATRQEAFYSTIWSIVRSGQPFGDTALESEHDNGAGISWSLTVPEAGSVTTRSRFQLDEPQGAGNARRSGAQEAERENKPLFADE